jgi:hypothetical protein
MSDRFDPDIDEVLRYMDNGHSKIDMAGMLGTSTKTLRRYLKANFVELRNEFDADDVDRIIEEFVLGHPKVGETQIIGHVKGNYNYKGSRAQFRASIGRVCGVELQERTTQFGKRIIRRVYDIKGPHLLWHLDGWHKLIRYRMVVFGCIDGGTRALVYASINNNNRATNHMRYHY